MPSVCARKSFLQCALSRKENRPVPGRCHGSHLQILLLHSLFVPPFFSLHMGDYFYPAACAGKPVGISGNKKGMEPLESPFLNCVWHATKLRYYQLWQIIKNAKRLPFETMVSFDVGTIINCVCRVPYRDSIKTFTSIYYHKILYCVNFL